MNLRPLLAELAALFEDPKSHNLTQRIPTDWKPDVSKKPMGGALRNKDTTSTRATTRKIPTLRK
jgi:hypothetical protein